jgi:hypothetical protein
MNTGASLAARVNRVLGRFGVRLVRVDRTSSRRGAAPGAVEERPGGANAPGGADASAAPPSRRTASPEPAAPLHEALPGGAHAALPDGASEAVPDGVREALAADHPRLLELRRRYAGHPASGSSVWSGELLARELSLQWFRRDNPYLWQARDFTASTPAGDPLPAGAAEVNYLLSACYVRSIDRLGLLDRLGEDGAFGAHTVAIGDGVIVSRDLLDSVLEIDFLDRHLGISTRETLELLDIGAGYGRLAHRIAAALPSSAHVLCTDAIAESTFLSEFYLDHRGVADRAEVVALDEIEERLAGAAVTVAVNVHSFPECPLDSIEWWLALLARHDVAHLFIVANETSLRSSEPDGRRLSIEPLLRVHGYEPAVLEPKYRLSEAVQRHGIYPAYYHLFRRRH